jgi:hypothetical protein
MRPVNQPVSPYFVPREQAQAAKEALKQQLAELGVVASVGLSGGSNSPHGYVLRANLPAPNAQLLPNVIDGVRVEYVVVGTVRAATQTLLVKFMEGSAQEARNFALSTLRVHGEPEQLFPGSTDDCALIWTTRVSAEAAAALERDLARLPGVEYAELAPTRKLA